MSWILLSLLSACLLGLYDIAKKSAVRDNAVPPVLLLNVVTAAAIWLPWIVAAFVGVTVGNSAEIVAIGTTDHLRLMAKSMLVGASWTAAFFALKALPLSIASPIRATSPLWTIGFAVTLWGERPTVAQWFGIVLVLGAFFAFSRLGLREGIHFHRDRWVGLMLVATLLGATSSLYDKYLLQTCGYSPAVVQAWFSIYLVPVMLPLAVRWYRNDRMTKPFHWRWSIPLIAVFLLLADYAYFTAVADPDALISVISPIRRTAVVIAFLFGVLHLRESNWRSKAVCLAILLAGVCLLSFSA